MAPSPRCRCCQPTREAASQATYRRENGRPNRRALGSDAEQVSQQRTRLLRKLGISTPAEIADAAARLAHQPRYRGIT